MHKVLPDFLNFTFQPYSQLHELNSICSLQLYYETERGRAYKEYLMNRDGFSLLVMGFTGKETLEWKLKYIDAFNKMEAFIQERRSSEWLLTRKQGKLIRRCETDMLANLVEYAESQGSRNMRGKGIYSLF